MSTQLLQGKRHLDLLEPVTADRSVGSNKRIKHEDNEENIEDVSKIANEAVLPSHSPLNVPNLDFLDVHKCCKWIDIVAEQLCVRHAQFYSPDEASILLTACEKEIVYNQGELATVKLFGKRMNIPRKQAAHGDTGLTYTFSGTTVPARSWSPLLLKIRDQISRSIGLEFNFVLINRYNDGQDYIGEHKDDERDLTPGYPIASLTLGQPRDFVFRHQDARGRHRKREIDPVTVVLEHGMLLLMKHPTNSFWYHSLPRRARASGVRVNMTFRKMNPSRCKPALPESM